MIIFAVIVFVMIIFAVIIFIVIIFVVIVFIIALFVFIVLIVLAFLWIFIIYFFSCAPTHVNKRLCPTVGLLVGWSRILSTIHTAHVLAYLALFS